MKHLIFIIALLCVSCSQQVTEPEPVTVDVAMGLTPIAVTFSEPMSIKVIPEYQGLRDTLITETGIVVIVPQGTIPCVMWYDGNGVAHCIWPHLKVARPDTTKVKQ